MITIWHYRIDTQMYGVLGSSPARLIVEWIKCQNCQFNTRERRRGLAIDKKGPGQQELRLFNQFVNKESLIPYNWKLNRFERNERAFKKSLDNIQLHFLNML